MEMPDMAIRSESVPIDEHDKSAEENSNPFDPKRLRLSARFHEGQDVRRVVVMVPVRKPGRQEFFRTQPDLDMWLETSVLEFKEERLTYLVEPSLAPHLPGEAVAKLLVPSITAHGLFFLWAIRLPDERGRLDDWNSVALEAAERAKKSWIRLMANMGAGSYDVLEAAGKFPDPEWPELPLDRVLALAFKDRFIEDLDHPVLKRLRGEV